MNFKKIVRKADGGLTGSQQAYYDLLSKQPNFDPDAQRQYVSGLNDAQALASMASYGPRDPNLDTLRQDGGATSAYLAQKYNVAGPINQGMGVMVDRSTGLAVDPKAQGMQGAKGLSAYDLSGKNQSNLSSVTQNALPKMQAMSPAPKAQTMTTSLPAPKPQTQIAKPQAIVKTPVAQAQSSTPNKSAIVGQLVKNAQTAQPAASVRKFKNGGSVNKQPTRNASSKADLSWSKVRTTTPSKKTHSSW
jgi:hypothetical protein